MALPSLPFFRRQEVALPPDVEAASLRSDRFRLEREVGWRRLEAIVARLEKGQVRRISDEDLLAVPVLYRQAASSLAVARETSLDAGTLGYLESLVRRAWFQVHGPRVGLLAWARHFLGGGWGAAVRALLPEIGIALAVMTAGVLVGWLLVASDPDWFHALVPGDFADVRQPGAGREALAETLGGAQQGESLAMFASYLFSNNTAVAVLAFATGFAFGIPTLLLLVWNLALLGAMLWVFAQAGLGAEFLAWLSVHGTTELAAIALAGAAGLHVGRSMAFPGERAVMQAAAEAGRRAAQVMAGVVVMLAVAGLLEGYARQLVTDPAARAGIGGGMLLLWIGYFGLGRRGPAEEPA